MKKRTLAAGLLAAIALMGMTVCAQESEIVIGEKTADTDFEISVTNETGKDIVGAAIRINYGEFTDNLIKEDEVFADKATAQLVCPEGEMVNYVPAVYDLELIFDDDTKAVLHTLPIGDADALKILMEEDVAYISFTSLSLNYETDTKRRETEIAEIGEKVLEADYEAKVAGGGSSGSGGGGGWSGGGEAAPAPAPDQCLTDGLLN